MIKKYKNKILFKKSKLIINKNKKLFKIDKWKSLKQKIGEIKIRDQTSNEIRRE